MSEVPQENIQAETVANGTPESKIAELEAALKDKDAKYLYLYAEFENFKKRSIKERSDLIKFGWENVARELLLVADNFERVVQHLPDGLDKNFTDGLKMVRDHFVATLTKQGVAPIEVHQQAFNPELHEAVGQEPSDLPQGMISSEQQKGYTLHGRLLRPSRVMLSMGKNPN